MFLTSQVHRNKYLYSQIYFSPRLSDPPLWRIHDEGNWAWHQNHAAKVRNRLICSHLKDPWADRFTSAETWHPFLLTQLVLSAQSVTPSRWTTSLIWTLWQGWWGFVQTCCCCWWRTPNWLWSCSLVPALLISTVCQGQASGLEPGRPFSLSGSGWLSHSRPECYRNQRPDLLLNGAWQWFSQE